MIVLYASTARIDRYEIIGVYSDFYKAIDYIQKVFQPINDTHYFWAEHREVNKHHDYDVGLSLTLAKDRELGIAFISSGDDGPLTTEQIQEIIDYANSNNR